MKRLDGLKNALIWKEIKNCICVARNKADSDLCTDLFLSLNITEGVIIAFGVGLHVHTVHFICLVFMHRDQKENLGLQELM